MTDLGFELGTDHIRRHRRHRRQEGVVRVDRVDRGRSDGHIERDRGARFVTLKADGEDPITLDENTIDTYLDDTIGCEELDPQGLDIVSASSSSSSGSAW